MSSKTEFSETAVDQLLDAAERYTDHYGVESSGEAEIVKIATRKDDYTGGSSHHGSTTDCKIYVIDTRYTI